MARAEDIILKLTLLYFIPSFPTLNNSDIFNYYSFVKCTYSFKADADLSSCFSSKYSHSKNALKIFYQHFEHNLFLLNRPDMKKIHM